MEAHWQCGRLLYPPSSWVWKSDTFLCVSLVCLLKETVSKTRLFKIGQYHLALLNSLQKEACEYLFEGLLA